MPRLLSSTTMSSARSLVMRGWRLIVRVSHDPVVALLLLHRRLVADVSQSLDQVGLGQGTVHDDSLQMALPDSRLGQRSGMTPEPSRGRGFQPFRSFAAS